MKTIKRTARYVCMCYRPNPTIDGVKAWHNWLRFHQRDCTPRRIVDVYLPEKADLDSE